LFDEERDQLRAQHSTDAQRLVAVSFSLWRAVFLADRTGDPVARRTAARDFLRRMLTDNAITFAQDMGSREWTFNYYMDNARFRLEQLSERWPDEISVEGLRVGGGPEASWEALQTGFDAAVTCLRRDVRERLL
jgi:hypothetical protein